MLALSAVLALASVNTVFGHGGVLSYSNAGTWYWGWSPYNSASGQTTIQRPWSSYNPIQDATASTIACNDDGTSGALQLTANVKAGSPITAYWNQIWPHAIGPMLTYMASCGGSTCTGVNANSLEWFKIDQAGLLSGTVYSGSWADGQMINQNSSWTSTVPSCIPSGNYLIRFETIALHSQPAQFYPECAQINVSGGGSTTPSGSYLVKFPGAYSNSDPGIDIDVYSTSAQTQTTYPIPGPALFTCGGSAPAPTTTTMATTSKPTTTTSASAKPTTTTTTTMASKPTTTTTTTTTASGATATHYGQCGGQGWTGPTACASPYTCTASSAYYSQCL